MEIGDQEDGVSTRRSGRLRGRKPSKGESPPSLVSPSAIAAPTRGSRGRGRGRGRPAQTRNFEEADEESGDGEGDGAGSDDNMSTSPSDSENSDSNPTNGFDNSNNASMEVEDSADNYGYSAYTTADLTDTSAIDGQNFSSVVAEPELGTEINFTGQTEFAADADDSNSNRSNEITYEQEGHSVQEETPTSDSNAEIGDEQAASPASSPEGEPETAEIAETEADGGDVDGGEERDPEGGAKRKLDELEDSVDVPQEESPTAGSEGPTPAKKALLEINVRKLLPDLEKHWKPVEDDPNDFTAWTYLLQYVDQENELLAAREAYDGFLSRYPYCYGYWKKYADYEKRKGSAEDCEQVFRRGLKAISLSVDLWIHYLNYVKAAHENEQDYIRAQFNSAIDACGMEFRSDKLWEHYIQWEKEANNLKHVLGIYDRVVATPTQSYLGHFQHMKDFVNLHPPEDILSDEEYLEIKESIIEPKSEEENAEEVDEIAKIREKIVERRTVVHKNTEAEITARWSFEEAIKRPYFHVKPLEKGQLKMWKEYLDFEIEKGEQKRIISLFERCLIACALYEEYWIKFIKYLQTEKEVDVEKLRSVFVRACTIHHQNKPWINMHWASFEESQGEHEKASDILQKLYKLLPESIHVYYRHINLERRQGNYEKCAELFEKYISECKNKSNAAHLTIKYARFTAKVVGDNEKAKNILQGAIDLDESTRAKVVMALVNLAMEQIPIDVLLVESTFDQVLKSGLSNEQKITFAHRKIEFLEDHSADVQSIEKAQEELQTLAKLLRERKPSGDSNKPPSSEDGNKATSNGSTYNNQNQSQYGQGQQPPYGQQYNQYGQYSNWNYQQPSGYNYNQQGWSAYQGYYG